MKSEIFNSSIGDHWITRKLSSNNIKKVAFFLTFLLIFYHGILHLTSGMFLWNNFGSCLLSLYRCEIMQMAPKWWKLSWIWKLPSVATLWLYASHLFQNVSFFSLLFQGKLIDFVFDSTNSLLIVTLVCASDTLLIGVVVIPLFSWGILVSDNFIMSLSSRFQWVKTILPICPLIMI